MTRRAWRRPSGSVSPTPSSPTCGMPPRRMSVTPARRRRAADVQDRRHLRGRVRRRHAVPLLDVRGRDRGRRPRPAEGRDPRFRAEPHRPGDRVRLLLRARAASPCARRATRRSWSTATRRRCRPTTTRATASTSSRSRRKTCSTCSPPSGPHQVIVSLGGQTPLKLAGRSPPSSWPARRPSRSTPPRTASGGTSSATELNIPQPPGGTAADLEQALAITDEVGFPVLVRPSYVLGGRAMQIVHDRNHLARAMAELSGFGGRQEGGLSAERPVLIDRFLARAIEVDVDAIRDHTGEVLIGGVMEHVEEAGVHSGDSACAIPPQTLPDWVVEVIDLHPRRSPTARRVGLINVQYAVARNQAVFVIEANPRQPHGAVRRQGHGRPLAKVATRVMLGATLAELRDRGPAGRARFDGPRGGQGSGAAVHPLPEVDPALGPEMRSTGEVMGIDSTFGQGVLQGRAVGWQRPAAAGHGVPVAERQRQAGRAGRGQAHARAQARARRHEGTAEYLASFGVPVDQVLARSRTGMAVAPRSTSSPTARSVRRQHAARLDGTHRWRAHPQGGQPPPGRLRDDRWRRPRRRPGTGRIPGATPGEGSPGVSRAEPVSTPDVRSSEIKMRVASRNQVSSLSGSSSVEQRSPIMTASRHGRVRRRTGGLLRSLLDPVPSSPPVDRGLRRWPGNPAPRVRRHRWG